MPSSQKATENEQSNDKMDIFDGYYYKSCKWFMELNGLWPYQSQFRRQISRLIFFLANASLGVPQFIILVQKWGKDFTVTCENTVSALFTIGCCAKYGVTYGASPQLKLLLMQIAQDWQRITDKTEREILKQFTEDGRLLVYIYTIYIFLAWVLYTLMPFLPWALDLVMPLNESRAVMMPFYANYIFFDQSDHHYGSCYHIAAVYLTSWALFSGTDTTFVISVKHTCGMFSIICHRLKTALKHDKDYEPVELLNDPLIISNLNRAIILHYDTIRCCNLLEDSFSLCFLMINCMSVVGLALSGVYVTFVYEDVLKTVRIIAFIVGLIMHLLYLNWVGQQIIDYSEEVFDSAYCSDWYYISTKARMVIKIIMTRTLTPCRLTAGKITMLMMESFGVLIKTSASYFTVFLSVT